MITLVHILIAIASLFVVFVLLRAMMGLKVCALCAAVATAWIASLIFLYAGGVVDPLLVGILMGGSVVGVMYLLEEKLPQRYGIFKIPFFMTLFVLVYMLLGGPVGYVATIIVVLLWSIFGVLFLAYDKKEFKIFVEKIIACCKNW